MKGAGGSRAGARLERGAAFTALSAAVLTMMATASAPSLIYPLYQERRDFSVTMLTVIFAVYILGLLGALMTLGSLSDHLARRPVLVAALAMAAVSTAIFWTADSVAFLLIARVVQGVAAGTAMSALAAGLVDFSPARRPHLGATVAAVGTSVGMAVGAAVVGVLLQTTARPDQYVFSVLTLLFLLLAAVTWAIPETGAPRPGTSASLRPRAKVAREARPAFRRAVPALVAGWAVTGLFLALTPSRMDAVLHVRRGAAGVLDIAALFLAAGAGGLWSARYAARNATALGGALLTLGSAALAAAMALASPAVYAAGSVVTGLGVGLTVNGNLRAISAATTADRRSEVFSAVYLVSYTALGLSSSRPDSRHPSGDWRPPATRTSPSSARCRSAC
ncbi:MFS transporter [Streptomyces sp. NPDC058914]|uniref:MFS transporter n=1 Tax=Streptomyces sp. NPDC058914 TaxID=3346671 RepID=UPI003692C302